MSHIEEQDALSTEDLQFVCDLVRRETAIVLTEAKRYLLRARLFNLSQEQGCATSTDLVRAARAAPNGPLNRLVVESLTTNETLFFRDASAFAHLKTHVLPHLIEELQGTRSLSIWCGASSTGQEPYSLAMLMSDEFPQLRQWNVAFLASDVDQSVLDRAQSGLYSQFEVNRGLPAAQLVRYFERVERDWRAKEELRRWITFRRINLAGDWGPVGRMDLVLLRHVLIYFDTDVRRGILERVRARMPSHGRLLLGASEISHPVEGLFQTQNPGTGVYVPIETR